MDSVLILNQHCPDLNICLYLPFLSNYRLFNVSNVVVVLLTHSVSTMTVIKYYWRVVFFIHLVIVVNVIACF